MITVSHKSKRKADLIETIARFLMVGTASRKEAAKLAGFAKGQVLGKGVDPCLAFVHLRVSRPGILQKFTFEKRQDFEELKSHIETHWVLHGWFILLLMIGRCCCSPMGVQFKICICLVPYWWTQLWEGYKSLGDICLMS